LQRRDIPESGLFSRDSAKEKIAILEEILGYGKRVLGKFSVTSAVSAVTGFRDLLTKRDLNHTLVRFTHKFCFL
jgi:hypothetical protein